ncbi:MAG: polysaccharide biosynthesis C-terminal domain-containing protein [Dehalococcoidia bacterium]|nr:polysaccharide biosynthesis C-terminal domain-containing protein [Dehalococcoidia bacterium]
MDLAFASVRAMAYRLSGMVAWAIIGVITARALSVADRGLYAATVTAIAAMGGVGSNFVSSCGYYVARRGRPPAEVAAAGSLLAAAVGTVAMGMAAVAAILVDGDNRTMVLLGGLAVLPTVARTVLGVVFLATHQLWRFNFGSHGAAYVGLAAIVVWVVVLGHRTAEAALVAWVAGQYMSCAIMLFMARHWWHGFVHWPRGELLRGIVAFGSLTGLGGLVSLANQRADLFMVAALDGKAGAGLYASAVAVGEGLLLFSAGIAVASYRSVGSLPAAEAARLAAAGVRHTLFIVLVVGAVAFALAPYAVELLFGPRYGAAGDSLRVLCVAAAAYSPQGLLGTYFTVQQGRPWVSVSLGALSCGIDVGLSALLIPQLGFIGGAWATLASYATATTVYLAAFRAVSGLPLADILVVRRGELAAYLRSARALARGAWRTRPLPASESGPEAVAGGR